MNYYLLIIRTTQESAIFTKEADYERCLNEVFSLKDKCGFDIRGFCLMPDYIKLVVGLNEEYAEVTVLTEDHPMELWENIINIFPKQKIFKGQSVRIADERCMANVLEYIELEPVRSGITDSSKTYRFCSAYYPRYPQISQKPAGFKISKDLTWPIAVRMGALIANNP